MANSTPSGGPPGQYDPVPVELLPDDTKSQLEEARLHIPRYLFRAWNNGYYGYSSGGQVGLNTTNEIVPLAFRRGRGHASVYDLSKDELTEMISNHANGIDQDFCTEFSSWTPSLSYAVNYAIEHLGGDTLDCHISMIDTRALWPYNQIFYAADLSFLRDGLSNHDDLYLVHGVIRGPHHRAISLATLQDGGKETFKLNQIADFVTPSDQDRAQIVTGTKIDRACVVGEWCGLDFALPMALALLCTRKRRSSLFNTNDQNLALIVEGVSGLKFPSDWVDESTIMTNALLGENGVGAKYRDFQQFTLLMRAIVMHQIEKAQQGARPQGSLLRMGGNRRSSGNRVSFADSDDYFQDDIQDAGGQELTKVDTDEGEEDDESPTIGGSERETANRGMDIAGMDEEEPHEQGDGKPPRKIPRLHLRQPPRRDAGAEEPRQQSIEAPDDEPSDAMVED